MAQAATSYIGNRVQWIGPPQHGYVLPAYWTSNDAGRRLPAPDELRVLHTGEEGTVTELVSETATEHRYIIEFDGGYTLEAVLPAPTVLRFLDQHRPAR